MIIDYTNRLPVFGLGVMLIVGDVQPTATSCIFAAATYHHVGWAVATYHAVGFTQATYTVGG